MPVSQPVTVRDVPLAAESFWPALSLRRLDVDVQIQHNDHNLSDTRVELQDGPYQQLAEMLDAFRENTTTHDAPNTPDDIVAVDVPLTVPSRESGGDEHAEFTGQVTLLLRLLDENSALADIRDRVFAFRGPGMVVRSQQRSNVSITARPYTAALVCGLARGDSDSDRRIDAFLKAAEPPAHDLWTHNTRAIKKSYKVRGCNQKLKDFDLAVKDAIRKLVSTPEEPGGAPPEAMRRHLRFGEKGGGGSRRFASVRKADAKVLQTGAWRFSGGCRRLKSSANPWQVIVKIKFGSDGAAGDLARCLESFQTSESSCTARIENGTGLIDVPSDVNTVSFTGVTDPQKHPDAANRAILKLRIDAREMIAASGVLQNA